MENIKTKVREFLARFFKKHELADDENIFELGFVNSLFAMQLVMFIEKEFDIVIDMADIDLDNFGSVRQIAEFVQEKMD